MIGVTYRALYRAALGFLIAWATHANAGNPDGTPRSATDAINALSSPDPARRDAAEKSLLDMGETARPAVVEASRSEDPELRARASALLMRLPWFRAEDSPMVQDILRRYGQLNVEQRKEAIDALGNLTQHGHDALLRLIEEEPSDDVKWEIVSVVRVSYRNEVLEGFRKLDTGVESAPLVAAAGHAWLAVDVAKGAKLLRIALAIDLEHPANDRGEVEAAYDRLGNLALLDGRFDDLAKLLRMRAKRGAVDESGDPSKAVLDLFAAHAKFGPLGGFADDVQTYREQLQDPRVLFALGKIYQRAGQSALATATFRAAHAIDVTSIEDRFEQGDYLVRQGWLDLAEGEFKTIFDLAADHSGERQVAGEPVAPAIDKANAHFRLARVAVAREDDDTAAQELREAMKVHHDVRGVLRGATELSMQQEIDWHDLRAARARGDTQTVKAIAASLSGNALTNPDIANDLVPYLRDAGRTKEARAVFDQVYHSLEEAQLERPAHPMPKNNLAWLCARCGERKEEALRLAIDATRAMPDNAAFVDTLAEAHFGLGHFDEAARLEAKVVAARPDDVFLRKQLERFKAAAAAHAKP